MSRQSTKKTPTASIREIETATETSPLLFDQDQGPGGKSYTQTSLLSSDSDSIRGTRDNDEPTEPQAVWATLSVLLLGVFVSQADTSLVLATYGKISSEFDRLDLGFWLLSAYVLAQTCAQPLYGKLSDIFGRKACLQASYTLFALGTAGSGLGQSMGQIILARAVQGAGGAGMVCLVSILITDLVPMHEVASLRSYVNIVQTVGRSCGGAIGGFLVETIGWRWSFLVQCPFTIFAILLVQWRLKPSQGQAIHVSQSQSMKAKLNRIDFSGAFLLSAAILAFCMVIDLSDGKASLDSLLIIGIIAGGVASGIGFVVSTKYWAAEPIFPLHLLTHPIVLSTYSMLALQNVTQMTLMMAIPMYFQVMNKASTAAAGAFLVPSVVGNTAGGLVAGYWIKRTGRHKVPIVLAPISSMVAFALCVILWTGEDTSAWKSLLVFPAGAATGAAHSAIFVALTSGVAESEIAIAGSGLYLAGNIGTVIGVSVSNTVYQSSLILGLKAALQGLPNKQEILDRALSDITYVQTVSRQLRDLMIPAYVGSFDTIFGMSLVCGGLALLLACITKERRLEIAPH